MSDDPIVVETRKIRDEYAASLGYDLGRIVFDLQSRQGKDGRRLVDRTSNKMSEQTHALEPTAEPVLYSKSSPPSP